MKTQNIFCVSHEPPLVPETLFDYAVGISDYRPCRGAHVSELDPFWDRMRPLAYGAAGNYVIPRAIERQSPLAELQGVFSHRKIVVRSTIGNPATKFPAFRELSVGKAGQLPVAEVRPHDGNEFLLGPLIQFSQGVFRQYAQKHHAIDLIDYLSLAVKLGVLTPIDVKAFALSDTFIPGGCELGLYPTIWLYRTLQQLERVGRVFVTEFADRLRTYDDYQIRAIGFLAERLGSYLLIKELRSRYPTEIPTNLFGCICVIVPDGETYSAALARKSGERLG